VEEGGEQRLEEGGEQRRQEGVEERGEEGSGAKGGSEANRGEAKATLILLGRDGGHL